MSTTQAFCPEGTIVAMNGNALAEVTKITLSGRKADTDDSTHMSSPLGYREFIATLKDSGTVQLDCNFIPNSSARSKISDQFEARELAAWTITFPEGKGVLHFSALITEFGKLDLPTDKKATESITLKVSGPIDEDYAS